MPRAMELFHLVSNVAESAGVMKEARLAATEDQKELYYSAGQCVERAVLLGHRLGK